MKVKVSVRVAWSWLRRLLRTASGSVPLNVAGTEKDCELFNNVKLKGKWEG
jgi:hypothetical protein